MTTRALSAVCPQAQSRDSGQPLHPPTPTTPVPPAWLQEAGPWAVLLVAVVSWLGRCQDPTSHRHG